MKSLNSLREANLAFRSGKYEIAIELYNKYIEENPANANMVIINLQLAIKRLGLGQDNATKTSLYRQLVESGQHGINKAKLASGTQSTQNKVNALYWSMRQEVLASGLWDEK